MFHETWRMENMFKKTLLAAGLTAAAFGANAQLTVTSASVDVSSQGLPLTKAYTLADVKVAIAAADVSALTAGAKVRLTFSGALVAAVPGAVAYTDTGGDTTTDGTFGAAAVTSTTVTVPFTQVPVGGTIAGDVVDFDNIPLLLDSTAVGTKINVTASILTSTDAVVTSTTSAATEQAEVVDQFALKVSTAADQKIDVANDRLTFPSKAKTDTIVLTATSAGAGATATSLLVNVKSDFANDITSLSDGTNTYTVNGDKTAASFTYTASTTPTVAAVLANAATTTLTATVDGKNAIEERTFAVDATLGYTDAESTARNLALLSGAAAGSWTLNGDGSAHVSFMPFGSAYSQSVTVQNNGAVEGDISVDWYTAAGKVTTALTTKAAPYVVTDISAELRSLAAANGITGNAAFDVIVNSPDGQINVVAVYYNRADGDRVLVLGEALK
jgi:hypothetical protein